MKYNYNLYGKLAIINHNQKKEFIYTMQSVFKRSFRNRINKINRVKRQRPITTIKKFNY